MTQLSRRVDFQPSTSSVAGKFKSRRYKTNSKIGCETKQTERAVPSVPLWRPNSRSASSPNPRRFRLGRLRSVGKTDNQIKRIRRAATSVPVYSPSLPSTKEPTFERNGNNAKTDYQTKQTERVATSVPEYWPCSRSPSLPSPTESTLGRNGNNVKTDYQTKQTARTVAYWPNSRSFYSSVREKYRNRRDGKKAKLDCQTKLTDRALTSASAPLCRPCFRSSSSTGPKECKLEADESNCKVNCQTKQTEETAVSLPPSVPFGPLSTTSKECISKSNNKITHGDWKQSRDSQYKGKLEEKLLNFCGPQQQGSAAKKSIISALEKRKKEKLLDLPKCRATPSKRLKASQQQYEEFVNWCKEDKLKMMTGDAAMQRLRNVLRKLQLQLIESERDRIRALYVTNDIQEKYKKLHITKNIEAKEIAKIRKEKERLLKKLEVEAEQRKNLQQRLREEAVKAKRALTEQIQKIKLGVPKPKKSFKTENRIRKYATTDVIQKNDSFTNALESLVQNFVEPSVENECKKLAGVNAALVKNVKECQEQLKMEKSNVENFQRQVPENYKMQFRKYIDELQKLEKRLVQALEELEKIKSVADTQDKSREDKAVERKFLYEKTYLEIKGKAKRKNLGKQITKNKKMIKEPKKFLMKSKDFM